MAVPGPSLVRVLLPAPAVILLAGCTERYPQSTLAPVSDFARMIDDLFMTTTWWGLVVFVLVEGLLLYAVLRYRWRGDEAHVPEQVHGHTRLEIAWTVAPALILVFIAVPTIRTIFRTQSDAPIPGALQVLVTGHQWWWEFEVPELDIATANELHVPLGRTVAFDLETADVIHSFWVPRLGGKRDLIPTHTTRLWFTPDSTGTYVGQCAEFCGVSHARMGLRVVVETPEGFEAWAANERSPAVGAAPASPDTTAAGEAAAEAEVSAQAAEEAEIAFAESVAQTLPEPGDSAPGGGPADTLSSAGGVVGSAARGAQLFQRSACVACHTIQGTNARGQVGPDLTHVANRDRIAAELLPNTPEDLARWLDDPPALKPGALMPDLNLKEDQIADLVAYLQTLK